METERLRFCPTEAVLGVGFDKAPTLTDPHSRWVVGLNGTFWRNNDDHSEGGHAPNCDMGKWHNGYFRSSFAKKTATEELLFEGSIIG